MIATLWYKAKIIIGICTIFLLVFIVDYYLGGYFKHFGIYPRTLDSLPFIITAPFIHGSWQHLTNNVIGFSIFSFLCLTQSTRFYLVSSFFIIVITGLLVWTFGRSYMHIGASGWIFGLWSLSIALAWFVGSFKNIAIAILVIALYGGMINGVLPQGKGISFESHLFGAISGVMYAFLYSKLMIRKEKNKYEITP